MKHLKAVLATFMTGPLQASGRSRFEQTCRPAGANDAPRRGRLPREVAAARHGQGVVDCGEQSCHALWLVTHLA
jgi:hypothetical protein